MGHPCRSVDPDPMPCSSPFGVTLTLMRRRVLEAGHGQQVPVDPWRRPGQPESEAHATVPGDLDHDAVEGHGRDAVVLRHRSSGSLVHPPPGY